MSQALEVRPASRDDLAAFYGEEASRMPTVIAWAGVRDGKAIAVGGVARRVGRRVAFVDLAPEARGAKVTIVRSARRFLDMYRTRRGAPKTLHAVIDRREPGAHRWLTSLGFSPVNQTKDLYRWQG